MSTQILSKRLGLHQMKNESERGAVMIWFALATVALLGMGSVVVDVGALWSERRQLQNGADAAALGVANQCAFSTCTAGDTNSIAANFANYNAGDNTTTVAELCGKSTGLTPCSAPPAGIGSANYVRVKTQTRSADGGSKVPFLLAPILDAASDGATVTASATVIWGVPTGVPALPILLSECEFSKWAASGYPKTDVQFILDGTIAGCSIPGGFSFANETSGNCEIRQIQLNSVGTFPMPDDSSGNYGSCTSKIHELYAAGDPVIVPVFDACGPCTGKAVWNVTGFIALQLCGYVFGPTYGTEQIMDQCSNGVCVGATSKPTYRLCGHFERISIEDVVIGTAKDYQTKVIKMID